MIVAAAACGGSGEGFADSIRVVLVNGYTGPGSPGVPLQNSLQVEIDGVNAQGGLLGRRVELVAADDEMKPAKAADLVREHLAADRVGLLVGPSATATFAAARQFVDQARVPNCLPVRVADDAVDGAVYTFRMPPADRVRTSALLDYVQKRTQVRRLGLASGDSDGPADQQLSALAPRFGVEYVGAAALAADPRTAVQQLLGRGAQGLVLPDDPAAAAQAVRALQDLGLRDRVAAYGFDALASLSFTDQAGDAAASAVVVAPIRGSLSDTADSRWPAAYRAFVRDVASRYGYANNGVEIKGLPEAAECVALWVRAVRRAGTFDGPQVVHAWEQLQVAPGDAVLGVRERFAARQHDAIGVDGLFVYQWIRRGDQFRLRQLAPP